jgi:4'-phosphopantetheinyl transferase
MTTDEIHLWTTSYRDIHDEQLLSAYHALLNEKERVQQTRFHFADDRLRYLVTRALVRTVLSRYVPIAPADWVFSTNQYGCPQIVAASADAASLSFNISHTKGLIVLGVTRDRALGVDVEDARTREAPIDVAGRFFAPEEVQALLEMAPAGQQDRFFEYWTFKESYIKARRMGLAIPLSKFRFSFPLPDAVEFAVDPSLGDDAAGWQFWQLRPEPDYLLAVCAARSNSTPRLIVRKVTPMAAEASIDPEVLRASHPIHRSRAGLALDERTGLLSPSGRSGGI